MGSSYDLDIQNSGLDHKIVSGLDRISQVFKTLLLEKSKQFHLSPIQIQLLIFIRYHSENHATISYLSKEFHLAKPTISETVKILEQKKYVTKCTDAIDSRSYTIRITDLGRTLVSQTENFINPLTGIISAINSDEKAILWKNINQIIAQLHRLEIISVQRNCLSCNHFSGNEKSGFCSLLNQNLNSEKLRIDCSEFEPHPKVAL